MAPARGEPPRIPRLDAFQRRHPLVGFPLAVVYKFVDDQGAYLAALIAYYALLSLLPLLLLLSTVLGIVLKGDPSLQQRLVTGALSQIPAIGDDLRTRGGISGGTTALIIGGIGALYGGLGVALAVQNAINVAWAVPRNARPNQLHVRIRGLGLLGMLGVNVVVTTGLTTLGASGSLQDLLGGAAGTLVRVLSLAVSVGTFYVVFDIGSARRHKPMDVLPGAVLAAVGWQVLQHFGAVFVERVVSSTSQTNGTFAVVLGLIAFLYLTGLVVVVATEVNVVRALKLHPRSLLTPFTDEVILTRADERQYRRAAQAQRNKGFEQIDVTFEREGERPAEERS